MADTQYLRAMRARALAQGDHSQVRALDADLERSGAIPEPGRSFGVESTAVELPERAVPEKPRRGRPPRPRCEHGRIADRCVECQEDV